MARFALAILLIVGGVTMCSCSEPTEGVKKPKTVTPPPERLEVHSVRPGGDRETSKEVE